MRCPFCSHDNTRVVDSRLTRDGLQIRRRRQCEDCGARFNTYESPEIKAPRIIKADGGREAFSEQKLRDGMLKALEKRPVETRQVERSIRALLREISTVEDSEIPSSLLGEWVMRELAKLDEGEVSTCVDDGVLRVCGSVGPDDYTCDGVDDDCDGWIDDVVVVRTDSELWEWDLDNDLNTSSTPGKTITVNVGNGGTDALVRPDDWPVTFHMEF